MPALDRPFSAPRWPTPRAKAINGAPATAAGPAKPALRWPPAKPRHRRPRTAPGGLVAGRQAAQRPLAAISSTWPANSGSTWIQCLAGAALAGAARSTRRPGDFAGFNCVRRRPMYPPSVAESRFAAGRRKAGPNAPARRRGGRRAGLQSNSQTSDCERIERRRAHRRSSAAAIFRHRAAGRFGHPARRFRAPRERPRGPMASTPNWPIASPPTAMCWPSCRAPLPPTMAR